MQQNLKKLTISGLIWSFVERFGSVLIQFISNIVLARLLSPHEFGLIGMIMVFIAISNTFVEGGFSSALIQKKETTPEDYSTIFFINILVALTLFVLLYFTAPAISVFYGQPVIIDLLRVLGIVLVLNAFSIIQNTQLIKAVNFKQIAKINLLSTILACILSITAALFGFGVWSIVIQILAIAFFKMVLLWILSSWKPILAFEKKSAKELVSFGYKLLLSGLIDSIYINMYSIIIGKFFTASDLGYFTQAKKMEEVPVYTLSGVVNQVTFPVFAKLQDDELKIKNGVEKSIISLAFLNFPLMIILIIIAKPLFTILFTSKWNEAVPYFQILCLSGMLLSTHSINLNILKAKGRSDLYLISEVSKKFVGITALFIGIIWGIYGMIFSIVVTSIISFFINAAFSGYVINYGIKKQFMDLFPYLLISVIVGFFVTYIFDLFELNIFLLIFMQITLYAILYLGFSKLFKTKALSIYISVLKEGNYRRTQISNVLE